MSDLDKWYYWIDAVSDTSKDSIATMHCFMQGRDIVLMVRDRDDRFGDVSDEEVLQHFVGVHWASEAPPLESLWRSLHG